MKLQLVRLFMFSKIFCSAQLFHCMTIHYNPIRKHGTSLCSAGTAGDKEYFVAFNDVDAQWKVRGLTSDRIGKLLRITGQVVRTHPVHPELVLGTFKCADCQTMISDVEQQFKYTQVF